MTETLNAAVNVNQQCGLAMPSGLLDLRGANMGSLSPLVLHQWSALAASAEVDKTTTLSDSCSTNPYYILTSSKRY